LVVFMDFDDNVKITFSCANVRNMYNYLCFPDEGYIQ
jgi:hypothetical protein